MKEIFTLPSKILKVGLLWIKSLGEFYHDAVFMFTID